MEVNTDHLHDLIEAATAVRDRAYAPYSKFLVGAALLDDDGGIHVGCNVENVSYGLTQCAERAAVTAAVAAGKRSLSTCVIVTDTPEPTMPCGACRQVLSELNPNMTVVSVTTSGTSTTTSLSELLPSAFDGDALERGTK